MSDQRIAEIKLQGVSATVPITNPHNVSSVYANSIGAGGTLTDFTLFFTELGQIPGESGPIVKHELKAAVTLPIAAADGLIQVLGQLVARAKETAAGQAESAAKDRVKQ